MRVQLERLYTSLVSEFEVIACYNYTALEESTGIPEEGLVNMQDLCGGDDPVHHLVRNAFGSCFAEFEATLEDWLAEELDARVFEFTFGEESQELVQLKEMIDLKFGTEGLEDHCGSLGFKLVDEDMAKIVQVNADGIVFVAELTDSVMLGLHEVEFEAYLIDHDPTAIYSKPLDQFKLKVEISEPITSAAVL